MATRRIGILGFANLQALDLIGPADVFCSDALDAPAYRDGGAPPYEVVIIGVDSKRFTASNGVQFSARYTLPTSTRLDTLIIPGGSGLRSGELAGRVAAWIAARASSIRRIASVCTGIYGLAPTGLLDGRDVATHWAFVDDVQRRFPKLRVDRDALFHKDERFYTSAGITAGIDLALAMVEEDLGPDAALAVAREMVVYLKRSGGQNQYSEPLRFQVEASDRFADLAAWIPAHLRSDLSVEALAKRACLSVRQFARAFKERFEVTPAAFVEEARLTEACRRLAARRSSIEAVARSVGYASDDAFRRAFERRYGVSPRHYRSRFDLVSKPFM
jgi:transcriptional regulator GlxA family with amidase domain